MRFVLTTALVLGLCLTSLGQESAPRKAVVADSNRDANPKQLLARIDALEQRIARLEATIARQRGPMPVPNPPVSKPDALRPVPNMPVPNLPVPNMPAPGVPPNRYQPYPVPQTPTPPRPNTVPPPVPRYQPRPNTPVPQAPAPKGWQRFEFNGQFFYIVPVNQVNQAAGQRR